MPEFSLEFEVYCECGEGLCLQSTTRSSRQRGMPQVVVRPCEKCLQSRYEQGFDAGEDSGYSKAETDLK